ncbi:hypothetical protein ig2599ANME_1899 [groundwater metagenome]
MTDSNKKSDFDNMVDEENLHCAHIAIITLRDALKMLK